MPDIIVIFLYSTVGGEKAGFGNVDQSTACPVFTVMGIIIHCLLFAYNISIKIRECLEPVFSDRKSVV